MELIVNELLLRHNNNQDHDLFLGCKELALQKKNIKVGFTLWVDGTHDICNRGKI